MVCRRAFGPRTPFWPLAYAPHNAPEVGMAHGTRSVGGGKQAQKDGSGLSAQRAIRQGWMARRLPPS